MRIQVLPAAALAIVLVACGGSKPVVATPTSKAADAAITIHGDAASPVNKIAIAAIGDLQKYWTDEYPKLYGSDYKPVEGGFFAVTPTSGDLPPCASDAAEISGNAFYCGSKDMVAWDAEGLLPELQSSSATSSSRSCWRTSGAMPCRPGRTSPRGR